MIRTWKLKVCSFSLVLLCVSALPAQTPATSSKVAAVPAVIRAAELQNDVAVLRRAYETLHPGLYRYNTKAQMDAAFEELRRQLDHDQSLGEAYLAFSSFAARIRCGHTYANFFNQPKAIVDELFKGKPRVPFYFEWVDGRMVVTEDFTAEHKLPRGTQVLAIDGVATSKILARLLTVSRADGSNDAKRIAYLNVSGDSNYEAFDIFYPLMFPKTDARYKLRVQRPGAASAVEVDVEGLTFDQRVAPIKKREQARSGDTATFTWTYLPNGAAWLQMPNWAMYGSKWDWKTWLNDHMDDLAERHAPALVIDLRGNEGGNDVGNVILSRIVEKDLPVVSLRRLVRYRKTPEDLGPYLDTWDPSFKDWGKSAVELTEPWPTAPAVPYLLLKRYDDDDRGDVIKAEGKHFSGKVYVLVDATNSSATFQFAQVIQQNHLGVLVGQPTGGSQRGINGGAFFFLRLPGSHIEMDLPLIGTFPLTTMPDAGLTPDVRVERTAGDIAEGRDAVMAAVAGLVAKP